MTTLSDIARDLGAKPVNGGYIAHCICHDDAKESMTISEGDDGKILFCCQTGCDQDQLYREASERWDLKKKRKHYQSKRTPAQESSIVAAYDYTWADGTLVFQCCRMEPKDFRQRRPVNGQWEWNLKGIAKFPLYRLPEVARAEQVFLVEGEKDANNVAALGLAATTNFGGAAKWRPEYTEQLADKHVVMLPDNDTAGEKHVMKVAPELAKVCKSIKVIRLPGLPAKGDVSDWLKAGGNAEKLLALAADAPEYKAEEAFTIKGTEFAAADYFVKLLKGRLVYTEERGFMVWTGNRWEPSDAQAEAMAQNALMQLQYEDYTLAKDMQTARGVSNIIRLVKPRTLGRLEEFDSHPDLLNTMSGVIDLRTGAIREHHPELRCSRITHANAHYDITAKAPTWESFLLRIMDGDTDMVDYLRRAAGYSLTGHVNEQVLFFCHGSGSNGKSVFIETLQKLLNQYACVLNKNALMDSVKQSGIPNDIARLSNTRYVAVSEVSQGEWLDEGRVKDLTGDDVITARFMRREFFDFHPQFKLWARGNHKPEIKGNDYGIWRRIHLIPFMVRFADEEKDRQLKYKLEAELDGILAWAVRGCFEWREMGLQPPHKVRSAIEEYKSEMDVVGQFITDCCELSHIYSIHAGDLYKAYKDWCDFTGHRAMSMIRFGRSLTQRPGIARDASNYVSYSGIQLKSQGSRYV